MKINNTKMLGFTLTAAICLSFAAGAQADPYIYAATSDGDFGTLDPLTGVFTLIGVDSTIASDSVGGIGFAANGNLYGLGYSVDGAPPLLEINTNNGASTYVGSGSLIHAGGFDYGMTATPDGDLYAYLGTSSVSLYSVNPNTAATTLIGSLGPETLYGGLAVGESGNMYITKGYGTEELYSVNPVTGAASAIGPTGTPDSFAMAFDGGVLYLADIDGGVWTVNTATGAGTQISSYNSAAYGSIEALASPDVLATPEPTTLALAGVGGLLIWMRRRK